MANEAAPKNNAETGAPTGTSGRRRSSGGFMPAFDSLREHKRASEARRQSLSDQQAKPGILGQFFHNNFGRNSK